MIHETLSHTGGRFKVVFLSSPWNGRFYGVSPGPTRLPIYPTWRAGIQPWTGVTGRKADLDRQFPTGYQKARPGNPVASLGQFLIELRDFPAVPFKRALQGGAPFKDIPKIALKELSDFKNLGSEYLNVVFGWKPFVSDLRKMYHLWETLDEQMSQIIRENGKNIRRRATILNEKSSTQTVKQYATPFADVRGGIPNWTQGSTQVTTTTIEERRVWFSGSFRYYIPDVSSSQWDKRARVALFGALPTPELLWEVLPWSWLVDWFGNIGDVVSNFSVNAVQNLTSNYAFVMEHKRTTTIWQADVTSVALQPCLPWICSDGAFGGTASTLHVKETKSRSGTGNPFGLNVQLNSLSNYQLGILAALGLSRSSVQ